MNISYNESWWFFKNMNNEEVRSFNWNDQSSRTRRQKILKIHGFSGIKFLDIFRGTSISLVFKICLLFIRKQQKFLSYVVNNIIFGIHVPDYPWIRTIESNALRSFWNFSIFATLYSYLHMTNSKVLISYSAYSISLFMYYKYCLLKYLLLFTTKKFQKCSKYVVLTFLLG